MFRSVVVFAFFPQNIICAIVAGCGWTLLDLAFGAIHSSFCPPLTNICLPVQFIPFIKYGIQFAKSAESESVWLACIHLKALLNALFSVISLARSLILSLSLACSLIRPVSVYWLGMCVVCVANFEMYMRSWMFQNNLYSQHYFECGCWECISKTFIRIVFSHLYFTIITKHRTSNRIIQAFTVWFIVFGSFVCAVALPHLHCVRQSKFCHKTIWTECIFLRVFFRTLLCVLASTHTIILK